MDKFVRLEVRARRVVAIYEHIPDPIFPGDPILTLPVGEWPCHESDLRRRIKNSEKAGIDTSEARKILAEMLELKVKLGIDKEESIEREMIAKVTREFLEQQAKDKNGET